MRRILECLIFLMIMMTSQVFAGSVYYLDATNGNDSNNGLSEATAWQTISKVNVSSFFPGDNILFKRNEIWREELRVPSSGSYGSPITFGAYGTGNNPIINGSDLISTWTQYDPKEEIWQATVITEPDIVIMDGNIGNKKTSISNLTDVYDWYWESNAFYIYSTSDPDTAYTSPGIEAGARDTCIHLSYGGPKSYITIDGLDCRGCNYGGLEGAIYHWTDSAAASDIIVQNCTVQKNAGGGIYFCNCHATHRTINITVQNNTVTEAGGIGIYFSIGIEDSTMDGNTVGYCCWEGEDYDCGIRMFGNWTTNAGNIIESNEVHHTYDLGDYTEGVGIWIDTISGVATVRYNFVHDNDNHGIALEDSQSNLVYYNLVDSNRGNGINNSGVAAHPSDGNEIYNNVCYDNTGSGIMTYGDGADSNVDNLVKNNISVGNGYELSAIDGGENDGTNGSGNVYTYNCFGVESSGFVEWGDGVTKNTYALWETAYGSSTYSVKSNPLMTSPANSNFTLQSGSSCINAGTDVGLTQDYAGNTVPYGGGVDIGAYESEYVGSSDPLYAEISASPTSGWVPLTVNLTGSASGGAEPYTYSWDFGDGEYSSEQNPEHIYSAAGDYIVNLTVTDSDSNEDTDSLIISASEKTDPLRASITASPSSGEVPLTVNFTASASGGTSPYSFSWDFGDGGSSSAQNPSHTYTNAGTYNVTLTVTDAQSGQTLNSLTITAVVSISTYQLAVSATTGSPAPGAGGTTDPSPGNHSYSVGNSVQVKAIPNENYRFSKWTGDVSGSEAYNEEANITMDKNKSISAYFFTKCGDVTGDLSITPADAQAAFDIFLGIISNPTDSEKENADVNCSGTKTEPDITPGDAQAIFEKFLGINDLPCDCSCNSRSGSVLTQMRLSQMKQTPDINLTINDIRVDQGGEVVVPIIVDNPFNIKAFGFDLIFPSEVLEFVGVERKEPLDDFYQIDAIKIADGVVRAGGYRSKPIMSHSPRVLITLLFKVIGEAKDMGSDSFSIVNTVDDIKNASYYNENVIEIIRDQKDIRKKNVWIR